MNANRAIASIGQDCQDYTLIARQRRIAVISYRQDDMNDRRRVYARRSDINGRLIRAMEDECAIDLSDLAIVLPAEGKRAAFDVTRG